MRKAISSSRTDKDFGFDPILPGGALAPKAEQTSLFMALDKGKEAPVVLVGVSGCGKTASMLAVASTRYSLFIEVGVEGSCKYGDGYISVRKYAVTADSVSVASLQIRIMCDLIARLELLSDALSKGLNPAEWLQAQLNGATKEVYTRVKYLFQKCSGFLPIDRVNSLIENIQNQRSNRDKSDNQELLFFLDEAHILSNVGKFHPSLFEASITSEREWSAFEAVIYQIHCIYGLRPVCASTTWGIAHAASIASAQGKRPGTSQTGILRVTSFPVNQSTEDVKNMLGKVLEEEVLDDQTVFSQEIFTKLVGRPRYAVRTFCTPTNKMRLQAIGLM